QRSVRIERCAPQRGAGRDVVATESRVYRIIAATSVDGRVGIHRVGDVVIVGVAIADIERTVSIRIGVDLGGVRDAVEIAVVGEHVRTIDLVADRNRGAWQGCLGHVIAPPLYFPRPTSWPGGMRAWAIIAVLGARRAVAACTGPCD